MLKTLKAQLLFSTGVWVLLMLVAVWCITRGLRMLAITLIVMLCIYLIVLNLWFWRYVSDPLARLTAFAARIAGGSYGGRIEDHGEGEIGELTDEINNMSEKVAIAEKSRTEFISQVSHELRTPLTAIMGWSETIAYDPAVEGDSLRGVQIISKEAERLTGMVSELLEFTRIQDGRFNLRIELVDITAELEDALFTYGELMKQAGIEVIYNPPHAEIPLIPGAPERLKQVFLNLLDNSVKHGGDGGKTLVSISGEADGVHISVRDYGHGIPEAELAHVKEKFYKGSSKNRGTGIGLSVCDEIITRHGGSLSVKNAPGGGCLVGLILPYSNQ